MQNKNSDPNSYVKFDPTNFNKNFELNDKKFQENNIINQIDNQDYTIELDPHKQPIENIIVDIQNIFYQVIDIIQDKQNPIPFIMASNKRIFTFSLFLMIIGTLLLILSTLMKSPNEL